MVHEIEDQLGLKCASLLTISELVTGLQNHPTTSFAREWRRLPMKGLTRSECLFDANTVVVIDRAATHVRVARLDRGVDGRALF